MAFVKARGGGFGMDAELASKLSLKFDSERAATSIKWIASLAGLNHCCSICRCFGEFAADTRPGVDSFPAGEMGAKLKDGRTLCAAANRLQARYCKASVVFGAAPGP